MFLHWWFKSSADTPACSLSGVYVLPPLIHVLSWNSHLFTGRCLCSSTDYSCPQLILPPVHWQVFMFLHWLLVSSADNPACSLAGVYVPPLMICVFNWYSRMFTCRCLCSSTDDSCPQLILLRVHWQVFMFLHWWFVPSAGTPACSLAYLDMFLIINRCFCFSSVSIS